MLEVITVSKEIRSSKGGSMAMNFSHLHQQQRRDDKKVCKVVSSSKPGVWGPMAVMLESVPHDNLCQALEGQLPLQMLGLNCYFTIAQG